MAFSRILMWREQWEALQAFHTGGPVSSPAPNGPSYTEPGGAPESQTNKKS